MRLERCSSPDSLLPQTQCGARPHVAYASAQLAPRQVHESHVRLPAPQLNAESVSPRRAPIPTCQIHRARTYPFFGPSWRQVLPALSGSSRNRRGLGCRKSCILPHEADDADSVRASPGCIVCSWHGISAAFRASTLTRATALGASSGARRSGQYGSPGGPRFTRLRAYARLHEAAAEELILHL